jgi:hypothetical protein
MWRRKSYKKWVAFYTSFGHELRFCVPGKHIVYGCTNRHDHTSGRGNRAPTWQCPIVGAGLPRPKDDIKGVACNCLTHNLRF